jgi:hypothetical protein
MRSPISCYVMLRPQDRLAAKTLASKLILQHTTAASSRSRSLIVAAQSMSANPGTYVAILIEQNAQ